MPKDVTKNIDRYKIRGGTLNEFEFAENQEQFSDQKGKPATKKAAASTRGASAKKLAARKAAKKK
jgi:hypothetical protein